VFDVNQHIISYGMKPFEWGLCMPLAAVSVECTGLDHAQMLSLGSGCGFINWSAFLSREDLSNLKYHPSARDVVGVILVYCSYPG
jgi:hypothetical protein